MNNNWHRIFSRQILLGDVAILVYLSSIKLFIPLLTNSDFGFHRDEFLYMAMGNHLAWGYLEVPPFIAFIAKLAHWLFGTGLYVTRFFPALSGALTVFLTGLIVREFGGKRFAIILATTAYLLAVVYLRINLFFMPVTFDVFFFVLAIYLLIRIIKTDSPRLWILFGIVTGIGLLNKYTMLLFGFGAAVGLLLTPLRRYYKNKWLWIAALIALLIWFPNLIWQNQNSWPFFEHMRVLAETQLSNMNPVIFILVQILMIFYAAPVWIIGLFSLFFSKHFQPYRIIAWMYLSILIVLLALSGKSYYLAPAYPMLLAAGAVTIERYIIKSEKYWLKPASLTLVLLGSLTLLPVGLPVLSIENAIRYFAFGSKYMGLGEAVRWETGKLHELPQDYADMLGWEEMVVAVAKTYHTLPADEKEDCAIFASNYGEAGAIDYYGPKYNLPRCISKGGSFWGWGYRNYDGACIIIVGFEKEDVLYFYESAEPGVAFDYPHARENGRPIFIGRDPKMPIEQVWQILKKYRF